jgi:hypothetical protein
LRLIEKAQGHVMSIQLVSKSMGRNRDKEFAGPMTRFKKLLAVVGATALLAFAAPAVYAQSGTEGYGGSNVVAGLEQGGGGDTGAPVQAAADEGASLPFTGADLGVLAAAGGLLLGLGLGLRRLTHRPTA